MFRIVTQMQILDLFFFQVLAVIVDDSKDDIVCTEVKGVSSHSCAHNVHWYILSTFGGLWLALALVTILHLHLWLHCICDQIASASVTGLHSQRSVLFSKSCCSRVGWMQLFGKAPDNNNGEIKTQTLMELLFEGTAVQQPSKILFLQCNISSFRR